MAYTRGRRQCQRTYQSYKQNPVTLYHLRIQESHQYLQLFHLHFTNTTEHNTHSRKLCTLEPDWLLAITGRLVIG